VSILKGQFPLPFLSITLFLTLSLFLQLFLLCLCLFTYLSISYSYSPFYYSSFLLFLSFLSTFISLSPIFFFLSRSVLLIFLSISLLPKTHLFCLVLWGHLNQRQMKNNVENGGLTAPDFISNHPTWLFVDFSSWVFQLTSHRMCL